MQPRHSGCCAERTFEALIKIARRHAHASATPQATAPSHQPARVDVRESLQMLKYFDSIKHVPIVAEAQCVVSSKA